jgi:hypothetical protein
MVFRDLGTQMSAKLWSNRCKYRILQQYQRVDRLLTDKNLHEAGNLSIPGKLTIKKGFVEILMNMTTPFRYKQTTCSAPK